MVGAFAPRGYWDSPTAILMNRVRPARGLERVSSDPFFAGLTLLAGAHILLARRATDVVFFAGFIALAVVGTLHQGGKLRARYGASYDEYLAQTSSVPFAALLRGKQRFASGEMPYVTLALGALVAYALVRLHTGILAMHGLPIIVTAVGGSALIGVITNLRAAR
jgi:uncharacterized membrane protein